MEAEVKQTRSDVSDIKRQVSKINKKVDGIDKDVKRMKQVVEELQRYSSLSGASGIGDVQPQHGQVFNLSLLRRC